jgi:predicted DNA binding CopG/RHH family protein
MTKQRNPTNTNLSLPNSIGLLKEIADYYDKTDTSAFMEAGEWVDPKPMATTSLRLPADVIARLKDQAARHNVRYTSYVRSILEQASNDQKPNELPSELAKIAQRLDRIEAALETKPNSKAA